MKVKAEGYYKTAFQTLEIGVIPFAYLSVTQKLTI